MPEKDFAAPESMADRPRSFVRRAAPYVVLAFGVFLLLLAMIGFLTTLAKNQSLREAEGTIIAFDRNDENSWPTIEYTVDGQTYRIVSGYKTSEMHTGSSVTVLYPASDPAKGGMSSESFETVIICAMFGSVPTGISLMILRDRKKHRKWEEEKAAAAQYGDEVPEEPRPAGCLAIFFSVHFYMGITSLAIALLSLILKLAEPQKYSFLEPVLFAGIGALFTGIGGFLRWISRKF